MSYSPNQARDANGRFAGGGTSEAAHRDAGKYPVTQHTAPSVATRTGRAMRGATAHPTPPNNRAVTSTVKERQAILAGIDRRRYGQD